MTDVELDQRFAVLRGVEPPPALVAATLRSWEDHRRVELRNRRLLWALPPLALAATLLLTISPTPPPAPTLVARGVSDTHLALDLRVVVREGQEVRRYPAGTPLAPGAVLSFRVTLSSPAVLQIEHGGAVFFERALAAGSHDLEAGWVVETGDTASELLFRADDQTLRLLVGPAFTPETGE